MRQLRPDFDGALHHVFNHGIDDRDIFLTRNDRLLFLDLLATVAAKFEWIVHTYCLMTNHFHLVIETPRAGLSRGMQEMLTTYVQRFNRRVRRRGGLFQGRFKSQLVEKESYLFELARYVVLNPVRAGMVARPEEYEWSSYRALAGLEPPPAFLANSWLLGQFGSDRKSAQQAYRRFVDEGIGLKRSPFDDLKHQIFLGSDAWVERMRAWVESEERSVEIPRAQRFIARPKVDEVITAVAEVMETDAGAIVQERGGFARMLVAHLAFREGLTKLRDIAKSLGLRSAGHISNLVRRCAKLLVQKRDEGALAAECLARLRPASLALS